MQKKAESRISVFGPIALVELTKGFFATVDTEDASLVAGRKWHVVTTKRGKYAASYGGPKGKTRIYMHRLLMAADPNVEVDHKNRDGLDNRRSENLRIATRRQNACNIGLTSANTSGIRGVRFYAPRNKWRAIIGFNGKTRHIGYFSDAESAEAAYKAASKELHGQFGGAA